MSARISKLNAVTKPHSPSEERFGFLLADAEEKYRLAYIECAGALRRIGLEPGRVHIFKLQEAMDRANLDRTARMALKMQLARLHLLDE
jgi:hypothetical protein